VKPKIPRVLAVVVMLLPALAAASEYSLTLDPAST
jgi:hypothetical protein